MAHPTCVRMVDPLSLTPKIITKFQCLAISSVFVLLCYVYLWRPKCGPHFGISHPITNATWEFLIEQPFQRVLLEGEAALHD